VQGQTVSVVHDSGVRVSSNFSANFLGGNYKIFTRKSRLVSAEEEFLVAIKLISKMEYQEDACPKILKTCINVVSYVKKMQWPIFLHGQYMSC